MWEIFRNGNLIKYQGEFLPWLFYASYSIINLIRPILGSIAEYSKMQKLIS
jgi:hypothetical protein